MNIIDNKQIKLVEVIKDQLKKSREANFAIGYFFLSGFNLVKEDFPENTEKLKDTKFLKIVMGNSTTKDTKEEIKLGYELRNNYKKLLIKELEQIESNNPKIKLLRYLIAENIIDIKLYDKSTLHSKLYLFLTNPTEQFSSPGTAVVGSSNFTYKGLTQNKELNVILTDREDVLYLKKWFDELWSEAIDFSEDLLDIIDNVYEGKLGVYLEPEELFKYFVYRWFEDRLFTFFTAKDVLTEFQLVGVINAIEKLNFFNGVIIADSVGLGKSFIAGAIIEEFIGRKHPMWIPKNSFPNVALILPPSTIPQWKDLLLSKEYFLKEYTSRVLDDNGQFYGIYNRHNVFVGKIAFISLGIFQRYTSEEVEQLSKHFHLFVIDEAHRFRNRNTERWRKATKLRIKKDSVRNKIILLTATPLNNSIKDIESLIRIFVDETFEPFKIKQININKLGEYQKKKKELLKDENNITIKAELERIAEYIKKNILEEVMILRTRKYIKEHFKDIKIDGKSLKFNDPKTYSLDYKPFTTRKYIDLFGKIHEKLEQINFEYTKLYGTKYVLIELTEFDRDNRNNNKRLIEIAELFRVILGKRLESSIYSFETTLRRIYEREKIFYENLNGKRIASEEQLKNLIKFTLEKAKIDKELDLIVNELDLQEEYDRFNEVLKILYKYAETNQSQKLSKNDKLNLGLEICLNKIKDDLVLIDELLYELDSIKRRENTAFLELGKLPKQEDDIVNMPIYSYLGDPKLEALKQILGLPKNKSHKITVPSLFRKKVIIFTQYKDTANYLYYNIKHWIDENPDINLLFTDDKGRLKLGLVTGDTDGETKINYIKRFAPKANRGENIVEKLGEIDILITTDTLSEGVNLQDGDAVINYDLPWNPMIIVQRVGRVNRIGNEKEIIVVNFVPTQEIDIIVGVLAKLKDKIKDITQLVGKDIKILSQDEEISIETFGEKIKEISKLNITELEKYGRSEDFSRFIPEGMSKKEIDELKLLNKIIFELKMTTGDFEHIKYLDKNKQYYTFIDGDKKLISIYEFIRNQQVFERKIYSFKPSNNEINEETPIVFLSLLQKNERNIPGFKNISVYLKKLESKANENIETMKNKVTSEQKGFIYNLINKLISYRLNKEVNSEDLKVVINTLRNINYPNFSKELRQFLEKRNLIIKKNYSLEIRDINELLKKLRKFFEEKRLSEITSLQFKTIQIGWFYETENL